MLTNSLRAFTKVLSGPGSVDRIQNVFTRSVSNWQGKLVDIANTMEEGRPAPIGNRPARVTVTGASGAIGYALLFRIASGEMLGPDQPVILQLLELPEAMKRLEGTVMEIQDGAFPLLKGIVSTSDPLKAFEGTDFALLVGASPRRKGQERKDLLFQNAAIFETQGKALNKVANRDTLRTLVVGNPANTNCLITYLSAPDIHPSRFTAMTKLDHNRGLAQIAQKVNCDVTDISRFCIWGNHSSTQYPDVTYTTVKGKRLKDLVTHDWVEKEFIPRVQKRGAEIIEARGSSSAASAADAAVQHMRDWVFGTNGEWTSMGIITPTPSYGVEPGTCFSYPVICSAGHYRIAPYVGLDKFSAERIEATRRELIEEATLLNSQQKL